MSEKTDPTLPTPESVQEELTAYVAAKFGGNMETAFNAYAGGTAAACVDRDGLLRLLADANVSGFTFVRDVVADDIMSKMNTAGDGEITWAEFTAFLPPIPPTPPTEE